PTSRALGACDDIVNIVKSARHERSLCDVLVCAASGINIDESVVTQNGLCISQFLVHIGVGPRGPATRPAKMCKSAGEQESSESDTSSLLDELLSCKWGVSGRLRRR